jgi:hypothetical protein
VVVIGMAVAARRSAIGSAIGRATGTAIGRLTGTAIETPTGTAVAALIGTAIEPLSTVVSRVPTVVGSRPLSAASGSPT